MEYTDILAALGAVAVIVLILIFTYYGSRWYARRLGGTGAGKYIKVHDRAQVGGSAQLVIAQVGERYYLLGIAEKSVAMLCELPDFVPENTVTQRSPFGQMFSDLVNKAKGKKDREDDGGEE